MKKIALFLLFISFTGLLGGCWDRSEVSELAIILGAGVDWTKQNQIRLTVQIARPSSFYGGEPGAGGAEAAAWVVSADGKTIEDAIRYLSAKVPREIYWGHCVILVLGEDMAKKGAGLVTNFFERNRRARETIWVMVARGKAEEFLETYSDLEKTSSQAAGFLNRMRTGYSVKLMEFAQMEASKGVQPVATAVRLTGAGSAPGPGQKKSPEHKEVEISGAAVFKEDKMIGWLDVHEARGLLWLKGEPVKGVVTIPSPGEPDKKVSIIIRRGSTKVIPYYDGNKILFNVFLTAEGTFEEQQGRENLDTPEKIKLLESKAAEEIQKRASLALLKAQGVYGEDIFGFGDAFHRKYKKQWRTLKNNWDMEFKRAEVAIGVEVRIRETGLMTRRASTPET